MAITNRGAGLGIRSALFITVLIAVALAIQLVTAPPAGAASLEATPSSGPPGASVEISGVGFSPLEPVRLCWNDERCSDLGQAQPTLTGGISVSVRIPDQANGGSNTISACQRLLLLWSCDSTGFNVIVPTTTTTSTTTTTAPTTTTTAPTTTTTTAATTTTTTSSAPVTTASPPPPPGGNPSSPPPGGNASPTPNGIGPPPNPPATSAQSSGSGGSVGVAALTNGTGSAAAATGGTSPSDQNADETTTTSGADDQVLAAAPRSQTPADGPRSPGPSEPGDAEAAGPNAEGAGPMGLPGRVDEGNAGWVIPLLALVLAGVTLWVADRLIKGDRRSHMMAVSRHR